MNSDLWSSAINGDLFDLETSCVFIPCNSFDWRLWVQIWLKSLDLNLVEEGEFRFESQGKRLAGPAHSPWRIGLRATSVGTFNTLFTNFETNGKDMICCWVDWSYRRFETPSYDVRTLRTVAVPSRRERRTLANRKRWPWFVNLSKTFGWVSNHNWNRLISWSLSESVMIVGPGDARVPCDPRGWLTSLHRWTAAFVGGVRWWGARVYVGDWCDRCCGIDSSMLRIGFSVWRSFAREHSTAFNRLSVIFI